MNRTMNAKAGILAGFAALAAGCGIANAQLKILIDLGNSDSYRGADVSSPDANGNHWNSVWSGAYYTNLLDADGNPSDINFGFSFATGTDFYNGPSGDTEDPTACVFDAGALGDLGINEAVYDYYVSSDFEIQNLDPTKTYTLTFFGSHKYSNDTTTVYSIFDDEFHTTEIASAELIHGGLDGEVGGDYYNQSEVAVISGVSPQSFNILYVGFDGKNFGNGYLNALMIEEDGGDACTPDLNGDGLVDFFDVSAFLTDFGGGCTPGAGDFNNDGVCDFFDVGEFLTAFNAGCP